MRPNGNPRPPRPLNQQAPPPKLELLFNNNMKSQVYRDVYVPGQNLRQVRWNNCGSKLACVQNDRNVRIWTLDKPDSKNALELKGSKEFTKSLEAVTWDPAHPDYLVVASGDGSVKEWDIKTKKIRNSITLDNSPVEVRFSIDGTKLAVLQRDHTVVILNRSFEKLCQYSEPFGIYEITWSNSSNYIACSLPNGNIQIVNINESRVVQVLKGHRTAATVLEFDPTGKYLAVGSNEGIVSIWELSTMICIRTFTKTDHAVSSLSFSHDGLMIAVAFESLNTPIDIVKLSTGEYIHSIQRNNYCTRPTLQWHPLKYILAATGDNNGLTVYTCNNKF